MRISRGAAGSTTAGVAAATGRHVGLWAALGVLLLATGAFFALGAGSSNKTTPKAQTVHVLGESIKSTALSTCSTGGFCISGDVTGLAPGTTKPLTLTVVNPNPFPIYVTQLGGTAGQSTGGCDGANNLTVSSWTTTTQPTTTTLPSDAIAVAPATSSGPGTATQDVNISFNDLGTTANQDNCLNATVPLTYSGHASWYGNCITGKHGGGLTVNSGDVVCLTSPANVTGGITVASGGTLIVNPGSNISGGLKSSGGATKINLCGATVSGGVSIAGATGPVWIGGSSLCPNSTISGGVTLTKNTGGVQVGGNDISGGLTCTGNNPAPTNNGSPNKVSGKKSGQCAGSF